MSAMDNPSRPRRDPRMEWIARNRLHPEHHAVLAELSGGDTDTAEHAWMGPQGRMRRNPHAVGFIGPNGRRRIDRSGARAGARSSVRDAPAIADRRRLVVVAQPRDWIAVVPDTASGRLTEHDRDLLGLARRLADGGETQGNDEQGGATAVVALVFGESLSESLQGALGDAGADRVMLLAVAKRKAEGDAHGYAPEARLAVCTRVERALSPRHWLFADTALGGGDLGRRLAIRLGERPACGVWRVARDDTRDCGWSCVCRSGSGREDRSRPLPRLLMALAECAEPVVETRQEARLMSLRDVASVEGAGDGADEGAIDAAIDTAIEDLGAVAVDPAEIGLHEAPFILSGGNGVGDWSGFHRAAQALGASEGASRVAVDDGHMPRHRQVGATGTFVSARVYLAVGISGAIQHLQGIQRCDKVIAINPDPGCDMVKRADLSVIGDGDEILAALVRLVEERGPRRDTGAPQETANSPKETLNVA